tara:strand:- start:604 stop:948 length:345 start_codon:yes stop_codon:yes gene_type:complete
MEKYFEEFNLTLLNEFSDNDQQIIYDTLKLLQETLIKDVEKMILHLDNLNVLELRSLGHKIKPNFQLIGLDSLYKICDKIEKGNIEDVHLISLVKIIISCLPEVVNKIKIEMGR